MTHSCIVRSTLLSCAAALAVMAVAPAQTFLGPTPYLRRADSPLLGSHALWFEDFEDHLLDVPGVTGVPGGPTSVVFGPSIHDSVDADDGVVDGSGLAGDSWFSSTGSVRFTFDVVALGGLPTEVGIVWTDGGFGSGVTFEAFDAGGTSIGTIGPVQIADTSNNGTTAEDRFFGLIDAGGIGAIELRNSGGGIEVDHLQYTNFCAPASVVLSPACAPGYHTGGGPVLGFTGVPVLGGSMTLSASSLRGSAVCALLIGIEIAPVPLVSIGSFPASQLCVSPFATVPCSGAPVASFALGIPLTSDCGIGVDVQWIEYDPTSALPLPLGTSRVAKLTVGP